jgi:hypothetical protein
MSTTDSHRPSVLLGAWDRLQGTLVRQILAMTVLIGLPTAVITIPLSFAFFAMLFYRGFMNNALEQSVSTAVLVLALIFIGLLLCTGAGVAACIRIVADRITGTRRSLGGAILIGLGKMVPVSILFVLISALGFAAFIPALQILVETFQGTREVIASESGIKMLGALTLVGDRFGLVSLLFTLGCAGFFIVHALFYLAIPLVVLGRQSVLGALGAAWDLGRGRRLAHIAWCTIGATPLMLGGLLENLAGLAATTFLGPFAMIAVWTVGLALPFLLLALHLTIQTEAYYDAIKPESRVLSRPERWSQIFSS